MKIAAPVVVCGFVFVAAWAAFTMAVPERLEGTLPGPPATPYIRFRPAAVEPQVPLGTVLVVHGLNSNKEFMQTMAMSLADGGFDVWVIDLPGHGDSPAGFNSADSQEAILAALRVLPPDTVVIGHSLGAGLIADIASFRQFEVAVLLSPPPIPVSRIEIEQLLIVSGRFDAPRINAFIPTLIDAQGGTAEWWRFPWAGHSTALYHPAQLRMITAWLGSPMAPLRTAERLLWLGLMTLSALIGPAILWNRWYSNRRSPMPAPQGGESDPARDVILRIGALGASLVLLRFFNPFSWLNLFRTDYLVGVLFIAGMTLWRVRRPQLSARGALRGVLAAGYVIGALVVVGSLVLHVVPAGGQWLRFPVLTAASLPLFLYDEHTIRRYRNAWGAWGAFLLTRVLLWAAVMTGVLLLNPEAAFLVLIIHLIVLAWVPLWWLAGIVGRTTGEPGAAALFSALVQGWVFSALFVTI